MNFMIFYKGNKKSKDAFIKNMNRLNKVGIDITDDYYNCSKKTLFSLNGEKIYSTIPNIMRVADNIEKVIAIINENKYNLQKFYVVKNIVYVEVAISNEYIFNNNLKVFIRYYNEKKKFEKNVIDNKHKLLSTYINAHSKVLIDFKCGHLPNYITPNSYNNGHRCPVCSNQKVEIGVNDILHKRPDIVKYLKNKEDAIKYSPYSKERTDFMCPICHHEKNYAINTVSSFGFSCPNCSDGISYPNKFISNLLSQLNIDYQTEVQFDWCKFIKYNSYSEVVGRYDVVIEKQKLIIEMDGNLGHGNNSILKPIEEGKYIDEQKDKLAFHNGYKIIRIICNYKNIIDRFSVVKKAILSSELSNYLDLSQVDWDEINKKSEMSYVKEAINIYNSNKNICAKDIGKILHVSTACVSNYLKIGNRFGLCHYNEKNIKDIRRKRLLYCTSKPVMITNIDSNDVMYFSSLSECSRYFNKKHLYINNNSFHENNSYYNIEYISREFFNHIKAETPDKTFGDFFLEESYFRDKSV